MASGSMGKKITVLSTKSASALKSHCETERRRRERINEHYNTLRGLILSNEKMDKSTLLAEVITQIKQLKKTATQATIDLLVPTDTDEVEVEKLDKNGSLLVRGSICCDYRPGLLSDLRQAMSDLPVQWLKCEISTLGGRVKSVFLVTTSEEGRKNNSDDFFVRSVRGALSNILDKVSASVEFEEELIFHRKRQRVSYFDSS